MSAGHRNVMLTRYFLYAVPLFVVFTASRWRLLVGDGLGFLPVVVASSALALGLWAVMASGIPVVA